MLILLLIALNGVLALTEIAIVSASEVRLSNEAQQGNTAAKSAMQLSRDPTRFLSTVQVGISLVGVLTGAFGGATLARRIAPLLEGLPVVGMYADAVALGLVVLVITYLTLVLGELVPKRLALTDPARWAIFFAPVMWVLSRAAGPIVKLLSVSTDTVLRALGVQLDATEEVTEDDIRFMMRQGTREGVFNLREKQMVDRVFNLDERRVATIMTPYPDVVWIDPDAPIEDNIHTIVRTGFSTYPVGKGELNEIEGMLSTKKLFAQIANGIPPNLPAATDPPLVIPEGARALRVLDLFKQARAHTGLVVDEYGTIQGIVTLSDFMLELVGVESPTEQSAPLITQREDGSYLIDGVLPVDELPTLFEEFDMVEEGERNYQTLGGFMMDTLGRIPRAGDVVRQQGLRFEIVDMDERRVDKVLISMEAPSEP
jgi:putative hemolysin